MKYSNETTKSDAKSADLIAQQDTLDNATGHADDELQKIKERREALTSSKDPRSGEIGAVTDELDEIFLGDDIFSGDNVADLAELGIQDPATGEVAVGQLFGHGQPQNLIAPPARDGYTQRFVRYINEAGKKDVKNISRSQRKGWVPRDVETLSEKTHWPIKDVGAGSILMVDGMVLCEMPLDRYKAFQSANKVNTQRRTEAVESQFNQEASGVNGRYHVNTTTQRGGKRPSVAPNKG